MPEARAPTPRAFVGAPFSYKYTTEFSLRSPKGYFLTLKCCDYFTETPPVQIVLAKSKTFFDAYSIDDVKKQAQHCFCGC